MESVGFSFVLSVRVPDVPLSVPDVTVPFCPVHGDCQVLCDSDCEVVEPQTLSLSRKREAFLVENQEHMNFDGAMVKAPPASRRKIMPPTTTEPPVTT